MAATSEANPYGLPPVTVVIPTRDRGDRVLGTLRTILAGSLAPARIIVSDQSKNGETEAALRSLAAAEHVSCVRTTTTGISAALNDGIAQAETELIAITGDDCDVACTWLEELARELAANPATGVVFGSVRPGRHAADVRFTPSYVVAERVTARSMFAKHRVAGTSACMALRKSVWERLGGFDEMLGVGSPLRSAEEVDMTIRALLAGFEVCETPMAEVVHHGDFAHHERGELIGRNWFGTGAAFAKPLKMGRLEILIALLGLSISWLRGGSKVAAGISAGPFRLNSLTTFLRGAWSGLRQPVDRRRGHFMPDSSKAASPSRRHARDSR